MAYYGCIYIYLRFCTFTYIYTCIHIIYIHTLIRIYIYNYIYIIYILHSILHPMRIYLENREMSSKTDPCLGWFQTYQTSQSQSKHHLWCTGFWPTLPGNHQHAPCGRPNSPCGGSPPYYTPQWDIRPKTRSSPRKLFSERVCVRQNLCLTPQQYGIKWKLNTRW